MIIFRKNILALAVFFLSISFVYSQKNLIRFEHISKAHGLSQSTVYSIAEDKYGFIWFATAEGLNRFDGYSIKKYYHESTNPNSLGNSRIYKLLNDSEGNLWIATLGGGLNMYVPENDNFISYLNKKDDPKSLSQNVVMSIFEDSKGILWVGTAEGGLNRFDKGTGTFENYLHDIKKPESIANNNVASICEDSSGNLWIATDGGGLDKFNYALGTFEHYKNDPKNPNTISNDRLNHILIDSNGLLWISTDDGLNILDPSKMTVRRILPDSKNEHSLKSNEIQCVFEDNNKNIWVATFGGLSLLQKENKSTYEFQTYYHNPTSNYSLSNNLVRSIFQDKSGIIWVGNMAAGVDMFYGNQSNFVTYNNNPIAESSLSNNSVRCFAEDKEGMIWIGTYGGGVNHFNPTNEQFWSMQNISGNSNSISNNFINAIGVDASNKIWIATSGGGLDCFNPRTQKILHYTNVKGNSNSLSNNYIRSMIIDKSDNLWIATSGGGLNYFDQKKELFTNYIPDKNNPNSISENRVMGLLEDSQGIIWVGSSNSGLNKLDKKTNSFTHFKNDPKNKKSLSSNRIFCITETRINNQIWIGTGGGGINKFNAIDSTFINLTKKDGLPSDVVYGILEDKSGILWISTSDGICKINPNTERPSVIKVYDEKDGLQGNEFNEGAYFENSSGKLYFGGFNGFNVFDPKEIKDNPLRPKTYIVDFQVFNKSVNPDSSPILKTNIVLAKELKLNYTDYVFSLEFAGLNFKNSDKNKYSYKMEGFDLDWIETSSKRRFVTYTNLNHGEYIFKVKSSNNDGLWNDESTDVKIIIKPPWWKTWWFKIMFVIFVLGSLFGFYWWRVASLRQQKDRLIKTVAEKTAEILHQNNELKTINESLVSINQELDNQRKELEVTLNSLREAQVRLVQSEKMASLGVFTAGIAHEINNPINYISSGVEALCDIVDSLKKHININDPSLQNIFADIEVTEKAIETGVLKTTAIISSLRNYTRTMDDTFIPYNGINCIKDALILLKSTYKNKIRIVEDLPDSLELDCIPAKLSQVFVNLLNNSIQSIEDTGEIAIRAYIKDSNIAVFEVSDSGKGIDKAIIEKIFDPFFTTKEVGKGAGLGLYIVHGIIKQHSGYMEVSSEPGKGSVFTVHLPLKHNLQVG